MHIRHFIFVGCSKSSQRFNLLLWVKIYERYGPYHLIILRSKMSKSRIIEKPILSAFLMFWTKITFGYSQHFFLKIQIRIRFWFFVDHVNTIRTWMLPNPAKQYFRRRWWKIIKYFWIDFLICSACCVVLSTSWSFSFSHVLLKKFSNAID